MVPKSDLGAFWSDFSEFRMQNHSVLKTFCEFCKCLNASVVKNILQNLATCYFYLVKYLVLRFYLDLILIN